MTLEYPEELLHPRCFVFIVWDLESDMAIEEISRYSGVECLASASDVEKIAGIENLGVTEDHIVGKIEKMLLVGFGWVAIWNMNEIHLGVTSERKMKDFL